MSKDDPNISNLNSNDLLAQDPEKAKLALEIAKFNRENKQLKEELMKQLNHLVTS